MRQNRIQFCKECGAPTDAWAVCTEDESDFFVGLVCDHCKTVEQKSRAMIQKRAETVLLLFWRTGYLMAK